MDDITLFAKTNFRNKERPFGIKKKDRRQHTYVIGKTGVGKTALLKNMALQDIKNGAGVAIVDPHGEFVEEVLDKIPSHRANDVVYFNPVDTQYPIGFNILEVLDPQYKHLIVSSLMGVFTKIWANVWSARMEYILHNSILALVDTPGNTLLGILRILVDKDYRQKMVNNIKDPVVKSFWVNEYAQWREQFRNEAIAPIQNKVGQFLNTPLIRNIVGQPKSTIRIPEIMDSQKILLVNVSKGRIGEDNSALLGAMLITKIQLAAMERVRILEEERKDFYLYIDEFQNFVTDSFASILSEARKYRLNLIIAHQYVGQLVTADNNTKVRDAVFGNVGTLIVFRVGAADAEFLEKEFEPVFTIQDLVNLDNYNIYLKLMIDGVTSRSFSAQTLPPIGEPVVEGNREKIIKTSRERYSRPQKEVEEKIAKWSGMMDLEAEEERPAAKRYPSAPAKQHSTTCWSCGNATQVSFEPDGKRPVFCPTCFEKAKKGERLPLSFSPVKPAHSQETKQERPSELEKLGIEFESSSSSESRERPARSDSPARQPDSSLGGGRGYAGEPANITQKEEAREEVPSPISLKKAFKEEPQTFKKRKRKEVNTEELRKVIEESLKKVEE